MKREQNKHKHTRKSRFNKDRAEINPFENHKMMNYRGSLLKKNSIQASAKLIKEREVMNTEHEGWEKR